MARFPCCRLANSAQETRRAATCRNHRDHVPRGARPGLSPRRAISAVYGLPVIDVPGRRTQYSRKLERWIENARKTINPATGEPYLTTLDKPKRWLGSLGRHPLAPRRAGPMIEEPKREGPHAGRTLTFHYCSIPPPEISDANHDVADVEIVGRWSDSKPFDSEVEPLCGVTVADAVDHMVRLNSEFEQKYPGARVRATFARP